MQGMDDASLQMLHGLAITLDRNHPGGERGAIQWCQSGPAAEQAKSYEENAIAQAPDRLIVDGQWGEGVARGHGTIHVGC